MRKDKSYLPKLLEYIDLANKVPQNYVFFSNKYVDKLTRERIKLPEENYPPTEEIIKTFKELVLKETPKLYDYFFKTVVPDETEGELTIFSKLNLLQSICNGLNVLSYSVVQELLDKEPVNETIFGINDVFGWFIFTVSVAVDEEGYIKLKTTQFFNFITSHKIEARRIRYCLVCNKIFWATRLDSFACSKKCGNALRQKNWQSQNKNEYNEKRRNNYAYKQAIKNLKEKKNGNLQTRQNLVDEFQLQRKAHPKKHEN